MYRLCHAASATEPILKYVFMYVYMYYQELMSTMKWCEGASNFSIFCKPSVVESHLCKLPYMANHCKLHKCLLKYNPLLLSR